MAITVESVTSFDDDFGTSLTFDMPTTKPDGDLYLFPMGKDDDQTGITVSGWTLPPNGFRQDAGTHSGYVFYRVGSSEPSSYTTSTWSGTEPVGGCVIRISGAGTPTVLGANANSSSCTAPAKAVAGSSKVIRVFIIEDDNPGNNPPSGHTNLITPQYFGSGTQNVFMAICESDTLGDTAAATWGGSYSNNWVAFTIEVPASSGNVFADIRGDIQDAIVSAVNEATGLNARKDTILPIANIVRTNDNVVTCTFAADAGYVITANEPVSFNTPASAVKSNTSYPADNTFEIENTPDAPSAGGRKSPHPLGIL